MGTSFISSFNKYILRNYDILGTDLVNGDMAIRNVKIHAFIEFIFQQKETVNKKNKVIAMMKNRGGHEHSKVGFAILHRLNREGLSGHI